MDLLRPIAEELILLASIRIDRLWICYPLLVYLCLKGVSNAPPHTLQIRDLASPEIDLLPILFRILLNFIEL